MVKIHCYSCNRYIGKITGKLAPGTRHICRDYPDCDLPPATTTEYNTDFMETFAKFTGIKIQ